MKALLVGLLGVGVWQHACADYLVQVEVIEVSHADLTAMLRNEVFTKDGHAWWLEARAMVERKEATLVNMNVLRGNGERKASVESVTRFIYPTEYDVSRTFDSKALAEGTSKFPVSGRSAELPHVSPAWDTEPVGELSDVEVTSVDGKKIDLRIWFSMISHAGDEVLLDRKTHLGNRFQMKRPVFEKHRMNRGVVLEEGRFYFLGVQKRHGRPDHRQLVFVRCDLLE